MTSLLDYEALFQASPNAYVVVTPGYDLVDVNEAFLRLTGRSRDEMVGRNLFAAFPEHPDGSLANDAAALKGSIDVVFATGRADAVPFLRYAIPIETVEGSGYQDAMWRVSHHPVQVREGRSPLALQSPQNLSHLREALREAIDASGRTPSTETAPRSDGLDDLGHEDLLRRAESVHSENRSLESDRLRLLRLFDQSLSFTVFMREPDHIVELANPAYLKMVGEEDLRGKRYSEAHVGEAPVANHLLDAVFDSGVPLIEQGLALRVPDGRGGLHTIYVDVVIQRIVDTFGKVIGVFMHGNDVTMAKATQDELHAYRNRLEEMVAERTRALERSESERRTAEAALHRAQRLEAVGKLTGGVAHDFNNVLQIIRGNLQLLQRSTGVDAGITAAIAGRVDAALDGVDRGAKLASQLLAFGRRQPLEPVVVHLGQVLARMEDLLRRALGESIAIHTRVPDDLWNTLVDVTRLENVIVNIAINARDAMNHRGSLTMELENTTVDALHARRVEGLQPGDFVTLAISDTGSGMSPEVQRRAFEPFFTTKAEGEGTGLGLSMVYGFMKQSGGHVSLYSEAGNGTTIRLYLPRSNEASSDLVVVPETMPARGNGETILVVEDDDAVRVTVVDTLTELGYRVLYAVDGQSASAIVQSGVPIDLLFTDVIMPGPVPSTEMVRRARELQPGLRILFTSGFTRDAIVQQDRLQAGVNLLSKPYAREELARRLRQLLDADAGVPGPAAAAGHSACASASPDPAKESPAVPNSVPPAAPADAALRRRVLLVEDNEDVRETTIEFINEVDYDVVAVETAELALDALAADRYDILFTDVSLPGINGIELLKRVRAADPGQRVVVASGYGADLGKHGYGAGVVVLTKPYDLAALEKTLNDLMAVDVG